jgi:nucleoside-triphosphatase THEP1
VNRVFVVTGPRGVGKSTLCGRVADQIVRRGLRVGGVMTGRLEALAAMGADVDRRYLVDLTSGEHVPFGKRDGFSNHIDATAPPTDASFPSTDELTPGWEFGQDVFAFGERAVVAGADADLLIVDELGPLELQGGRGWVGALEVLRQGTYRAALVVCRPELLDDLWQALGMRPDSGETAVARARVFSLTVDGRDAAATSVARALLLDLARADRSGS